MNKTKASFIFATMCLLSASTFAHFTVRNEANGLDSISGKTDTFRLNLPVMPSYGQDVVSIRLDIPENVTFLYLEPVAGWTYELTKENDKITSVTYKGVAKSGELIRFPFIARNPDKGDTVVQYKAYVTLKDGKVVPYDGSEAAKGYAPKILVK